MDAKVVRTAQKTVTEVLEENDRIAHFVGIAICSVFGQTPNEKGNVRTKHGLVKPQVIARLFAAVIEGVLETL